MKKFFIGTIVGATAAAIGYKLYKNNEDEIKAFLEEHLGSELDVDIEDMDLDELEELREYVDDIIGSKEEVLDELNSENNENEAYITIDSTVTE